MLVEPLAVEFDMRLEHVGVWVKDLEAVKRFYETYLGATAGAKYVNAKKAFASYFLTFDSGARLEIMQKADIGPRAEGPEVQTLGYAHLAISVGSEAEVDALTERIGADGHRVFDGPRHTGDGCYESVVLDPEGNRIEITA